jgi:6-phosphogluconolactonase
MKIQIFSSFPNLITAAVDLFISSARQMIQDQGYFTVALSGGSTPKPLYDYLARHRSANNLEWDKIHFFWSDERSVPPDHQDSNYRQARLTLLEHRQIPPENIHRIQGELEPSAAAEIYQEDILAFFSGADPRFDLILLGMGTDGHTASIFPGTKVAALPDDYEWVAANHVPELKTWRITFTPRLINIARKVLILAAGKNKAAALKHVLEGAYQPEVYPAQLVKPENGDLIWMVDREASSTLNPN